MKKNKFGFVGAGKMASAIVRGMIKGGAASPEEISCVCGDDNTGKALAESTGIGLLSGLDELCGNSLTVVLACKPQQFASLSDSAAASFSGLLISILAGTSISRLRQKFPNARNVVRVMPNMPAQISMGFSCFAPDSPLSEEDSNTVYSVLSAIGDVSAVKESQLDAVTAVSGSGPGYIFEFAAAMIEAAKNMGFDEDLAKRMVLKTMSGSAELLMRSELSAEELRKAVCSPGGTTLAALSVFEERGFRKTVADALAAADKRSKELSKL